MVIRKISKKNNKVNIKEDYNEILKENNKGNVISNNKTPPKKVSLKDITKQREAKEKLEKEQKKQKELEEKKEKVRLEKIAMDYMDHLWDQIQEKKLESFWVFPDRKGFKKIQLYLPKDLEKMTMAEPEKYKNRTVVNFIFRPIHDVTDPESKRIQYGFMLMLHINVNVLDDKGRIIRKPSMRFGCVISWEVEDFRITKVSFKLLEKIMYAMLAVRKSCYFITGYPFRNVLKDLEEEGYDFSDVLNPLAGL